MAGETHTPVPVPTPPTAVACWDFPDTMWEPHSERMQVPLPLNSLGAQQEGGRGYGRKRQGGVNHLPVTKPFAKHNMNDKGYCSSTVFLFCFWWVFFGQL